ncbi:hypothetical protein [Shewanella sp. OMA3-2]|uniref:hypothetical protein n=1 Tax=Shewanella sp. OMA3-2 TaxID=2908650 RepID=UPI001F266956|nr:hypothetical protein [Shewanella sp. OMA3-2]UJF21192.1 hypothetical protein L0B17_13750 [Shewanella sp. OMA3-2]
MRYIFILLTFFISITFLKANEFEYKHLALGTWEITGTHYCPNVCALDDEQASSYSGTIIELLKFEANVGDKNCRDVSYLYRHLTSTKFVQKNRYHPARIGIDGDTVVEVSLYCGGLFGERLTDMASHFYIKNQNEILISFDGVNFLAKRIK